MPAANHSFSIEQGSDFQITFRYLDENNTRVNLTNYYVLFKFVTNTGQIYSFDNITKTLDYSLVASQKIPSINPLVALLLSSPPPPIPQYLSPHLQ